MIKKRLWSKPFEYGLDEVDVKILNTLSTDFGFLNSDLAAISRKTGINKAELRMRIRMLKEKKIILKSRVSLIDILKIWDLYLLTFIKTKLETPVEGLKIKTPIGWTGIMDALISARNKFKTNMIRQAFTLHGTEWDLLLVRTVNDQVDAEEFLEFIVEEGWVEAGWTIRPSEGVEYIFDPVAAPSLNEYSEMVEKPLRKSGKIWKKAIEHELYETDIRILNALAEDSGFSELDYERIATIIKEDVTEVKKRIRNLQSKGIVKKERTSVLDLFELWDYCLLTLIKARDYKRIFSEIKKRSKQTNIIRQAFITWGGDWNLILFTTVNKISNFERFINPIIKKHHAEKVWTVKQQDIDEKIFDPIAVPAVEDYKERVWSVLQNYKKL